MVRVTVVRRSWPWVALAAAALCGWPGPATRADGVQAGPGPTAFLAGQVVDGHGQGVPDATVILGRGRQVGSTVVLSAPLMAPGRAGAQAPLSVMTDSQGRFFFADLPPGSYVPVVSKLGYLPVGAGDRAVPLAAGERVTNARVRLIQLGTLAGSVRDDADDPVVKADVVALRRGLVNGRPDLQLGGTAQTDDRGMFRIDRLRPGDYLVCACHHDAIPFDGQLLTTLAADPVRLLGLATRAMRVGADVAVIDGSLPTNPMTFYPNSPTTARAELVTVLSGTEKPGVDIRVTSVRAARVSGRITGAASAVRASELRLVPAGETGEGMALTAMAPVLVQPDGRFDFASVPPGQYVLVVNHVDSDAVGVGPSGEVLEFLGARGVVAGQRPIGANPANDVPKFAAVPVTVGESDVSGLSVPLVLGAVVRGRVDFTGSAPPPSGRGPEGVIMQFLVQPLSAAPSQPATGAVCRVVADGSFHSAPLAPGRYQLQPLGPPQGWPTIASVTANGADLLDLGFDVGATDISDVRVVYSDVPQGTLAGTLLGGAPAPGTDLTVLVFPADHKYWIDPDAARRRFRTAVVDRTGGFTIGPLPAGAYLSLVVPDDQAIEWQAAATLEALSKRAMTVALVDGDKKTITVRR